jgi:hypothetical protein
LWKKNTERPPRPYGLKLIHSPILFLLLAENIQEGSWKEGDDNIASGCSSVE